MMSAEDIIGMLGLSPHPAEGGFFMETYRSAGTIRKECLPAAYSGPRAFGTAIYYLLTPETVSAMHRLPGDEIFHFYLGDPVTMLHLYPDGSARTVVMGQDIAAGQRLQVVAPGGVWQGAFLAEGGRYALLGTTMAPGFDYADYESGAPDALLARYPTQRALIEKLTPPPGQ